MRFTLPSPQDALAIEQVILRFFANIDDKVFDDDVYGRLLTDDATMTRPNGAVVGAVAVCQSHRESFARFRRTQHTVTNLTFEAEGDQWLVRGNVQAMHLWSPEFIEPTCLETYFLAQSVLWSRTKPTPEGWKIHEVRIEVVFRQGSNASAMRATR